MQVEALMEEVVVGPHCQPQQGNATWVCVRLSSSADVELGSNKKQSCGAVVKEEDGASEVE